MPQIAISGGPNPIEHAITHKSDISALMPEPQSSAETSEESGGNIKDPGNSPAIAQGSRSLEPLAGESFCDFPGVEAVTSLLNGSNRMRGAGISPEAVRRVFRARQEEGWPTPHYPSIATSLSCEG